MSDIRPVFTEEVRDKISEELKLIVLAAATISTQGIEPKMAVNAAYAIYDVAKVVEESRLEKARQTEYRRRRGY